MQYELRESSRAKHLRITVHPDGRVVVTKPARVSLKTLERWLQEREAWIEQTREKMLKSQERFEKAHGTPVPLPKLRRGTAPYAAAVAAARSLATARTAHFAALGGYQYGSISIRNQKTRWGSCSAPRNGLCNISFNYRIAHLPPELADYLVMHELAHTKHHDHSARFWAEVARFIPDYRAKRSELHRYRF